MVIRLGRARAVARNNRPQTIFTANAFAFLLLLVAAKLTGIVGITGGEVIIIIIRVVVPLMIFRYWLVGGIVAMVIDALDVVAIDLIGLGGFQHHYAETDKLLDCYYYVIELMVVLRWSNRWIVWPAVVLFVHRIVGAAIFEFTSAHIVLFIFPNLFENWFLYCVVVMRWFPSVVPRNWKTILIPLLAMLGPKLAQEYLLHVAEAEPWDWTKHHILEPIGINL